MIRSVYILGNHIQSLGVARMADKIDLKVSLFSDYPTPVTRFSRACHSFYLFRDTDHLLDLLNRIDITGETPLLIPTNDYMVNFLGEHYDILKEKYALSIPSPEIVNICLNKRLTYQSASRLGVSIPESHFPDTREQLNQIAPEVTYPVIIKPSVMHTFYSSTSRKAYLCHTKEELFEYYDLALRHISPEEIIIQEFLTGGAPSLYSCGSFTIDGEPFGSFVANRIRQKPMDFGVSTTFAKTVISREIEEQAERFLKGIRYTGISEVEFMYDSAKEVYKLLEINPRTWKWHSIINLLGINYIELLVKFHRGEKIPKFRNETEDIAWVERITDSYVVIKEMIRGKMSMTEYLNTMKLHKEYAAWSTSDPLPAIMYLLLTPYLYFKR
jgi:predicted ATP-grasp superfamily ATP-dependent carboligase